MLRRCHSQDEHSIWANPRGWRLGFGLLVLLAAWLASGQSAQAATIDISGTVYSDEGSTALGSKTVRIAVNGTDGTTAESNASTGAYSFSSVTVTAGDVLTLYLEDETQNAVTVTVTPATNLTGIDLYQDYLITRCDNSCSLTNANLSTANVGSGEEGGTEGSDITSIYTVSGSTITTESTIELFIPSSHTYAPGGTTNLQDGADINGTYTGGANAINVSGGDWDATGGSFSTSGTFTVTNSVTVISDGDAFGTVAIGDGATDGDGAFSDAADIESLTFNSTSGNAGVSFSDTLNLEGDLNLTEATSFGAPTTVVLDGAGALVLDTNGNALNNLTLGGTAAPGLEGDLDIDGDLTIASGTTLDVGNGLNHSINVAGSWNNTGGTFTERTGTVTFDGTGSHTIADEAFYNLTINNASGTWTTTASDNVFNTIANDLTITAGVIDFDDDDFVIGNNFNNTGTLRLQGGQAAATFTNGMDTNSGTVEYDGTGSYSSLLIGNTYYNLTFSGSGTFTLGANVDVNNNLVLSAGTLDVHSTNNRQVNVGGNWTDSGGTFTERSGTVVFDGSSTVTSNGDDFNNVTIAAGSSVTTADDMDINGTFSVTNGGGETFDISDDTVNFAGTVTLTNLDTFTVSSSTVVFDGSTTLTSASKPFNNVTVGAGGSLTTADDLDVDGAFSVTNGGGETFNPSGDTISFAGDVNLTNLDTFTQSGTTYVFDGTTTLTSDGEILESVQLGTGSTGASLTTADAATFGQDLSDSFSVLNGGATTLNISDDTLTISADDINFTNLDTFTVTSSTVKFSGPNNGSLTSAGVTFNNFESNGQAGATLTIQDALDVDGNLVLSAGALDVKSGSDFQVNVGGNWSNTGGAFTERSGTVVFDGSGSQTVTAETFNNLTIDNSAGSPGDSTDVDAAAVTVNGTLTVTDGQFQPATSADFDGAVSIGSNGILKPDASAAITVAGDWTNTGTFTHNSGTVTFDGSGLQTITGTPTFNNLTVANTAGSPGDSVDVDAPAITVSGTLTVSDGQFQPATSADFDGAVTIGSNGILKPDASASITVAGDWTNNGTFTHNSGTVTFDGSGAQTINDANTWSSLVISGGSRTVSLESSVTQTVAGSTFTLAGSSGNVLTLAPLTAATTWLLDVDSGATQSVSYVSSSYSNASAGAEIDADDGTNTDGGNNSNWDFVSNTAPTVTKPSSISQNSSTGYVQFTTTVSDGENNNTTLQVEYSRDNSTWHDLTLVSVSVSDGTASIDNGNAFQVQGVDTAIGDITVTLTWDSRAELAGIYDGSVYLRVTPNDGTVDGTTVASDSFVVNNQTGDFVTLATTVGKNTGAILALEDPSTSSGQVAGATTAVVAPPLLLTGLQTVTYGLLAVNGLAVVGLAGLLLWQFRGKVRLLPVWLVGDPMAVFTTQAPRDSETAEFLVPFWRYKKQVWAYRKAAQGFAGFAVLLVALLYTEQLLFAGSTLVDNGATVEPGDTLTYKVSYTSARVTELSDVVLTIPLPGSTTYVAGSGSVNGVGVTDSGDGDSYSVSGSTVTVSLGTVAAEATGFVLLRTALPLPLTSTPLPSSLAVTATAAATDEDAVSASATSNPVAVATVSGAAFSDTDGNGSKAAGEAAVAGASVTVTTAGGATVGSTTTDSGGAWSVTGLRQGTYTVTGGSVTDFTTPAAVSAVVTQGGSSTAALAYTPVVAAPTATPVVSASPTAVPVATAVPTAVPVVTEVVDTVAETATAVSAAVGDAVETVEAGLEAVAAPVRAVLPEAVVETLTPVAKSPAATAVTTTAAAVAVVAAPAATASVLTTTAPSVASQLPYLVPRLWQALLGLLGFRSKKRPWGRVLNARDGSPVAGAVVQIYDQQSQRLKDTVVSKGNGAFASWLGAGQYEVRVSKPGWEVTPKAPFLRLLGGERVYDGRSVAVAESGVVALVVALRPTTTVASSQRAVWFSYVQRLELILARLSWPLLILGVAFNTGLFVLNPTIVNGLIEALYVVLIAAKVWVERKRKHFAVGSVVDAVTGTPVDLAMVRLYAAETNRLVATRITDAGGKFFLLPEPGVYTASVIRSGYQAYREGHVVVKPGEETLALRVQLAPMREGEMALNISS